MNNNHQNDVLFAPLREECAAIEHTRWAKWQEYFFGQCIEKREENGYMILALPMPKYERWMKQIATPYAELSEQEKDSDRREVDSYMPLVLAAFDKVRAEERSEVREAVLALYKILGMNIVTKEFVITARMAVQAYEEENRAKYIRSLQDALVEALSPPSGGE